MSNITFLTINQVKTKTSLSSSSIYRLIAEGRFPRSIHVFRRRVAWIESEVQDWVDAIVANNLGCTSGLPPVQTVQHNTTVSTSTKCVSEEGQSNE